MKITVVQARAQAAILSADAQALMQGAATAEAAGQTDFDTVDALSAYSQSTLDSLQAAIDAAKAKGA